MDRPVDPRAWGATDVLFARFGAGFAVARQPSRLTRLLARRGSPHFCLDLGDLRSEREWQLAGWVVAGDLDGETWRASTDSPGVARRPYFIAAGYRHLVVRITDDLCGGTKSVAVNGVPIGTFVRPARRVEWTTQQYEVPAGTLRDGELVIEFTGFGVAISDVALVTERLRDGELRSLAGPETP